MPSVAELVLLISGKDQASGALKGVGKEIDVLGVKVSGKMLAAGAVGAAALGGIGVAALGVADDVQKATNTFQVELGLATDDAVRLADVAKDVYGNNFAGSIEDAAGVIATAYQQMGDVGDEALQRISENAIRLQDSFGVDTAEGISAAKTLMENFGITSEEAFDLIAAGYQKGLNRSGDFLDTVEEYSTQFANGGADVKQFFSLLDSGLQGGMLGTDKAADAFKEYRVRILDGSKATNESLEALGINVEEFTGALARGEMTTAESFNIILGKLREVDDEGVRMRAGVGLLGTQFEDLGTDAALGLDITGKAFADTEGAVDSLDAKYNTLGATIEGWKRKALLQLSPIADKMNDFLPIASQMGMAFAGVAPAIGAMGPAFLAASAGAKALGLAMLTPPLGIIIALVAVGVAAYLFRDQIADAFRAVWKVVGPILENVTGALGDVVSWVQANWPIIAAVLTGPVGLAVLGIVKYWDQITSGVTDAATAVLDFLKGNWPEIASIILLPFAPLIILATDAFGIRSALIGAFTAILDFARGFLSDMVGWATDLASGILDALVALPGDLLAVATDAMTGFFEEITGIGSDVMQWFIALPSAVLAALGDLKDTLVQAGKDLIQGFIDGMTSIPIPNPLDMVPGGGIIKKGGGFVAKGIGAGRDALPFANGLWEVPGPRGAGDIFPALLSPGEMVIPARQADEMRSGAGGGDITIHFNGPVYPTREAKSPRSAMADVAFAAAAELRSRGVWVPL